MKIGSLNYKKLLFISSLSLSSGLLSPISSFAQDLSDPTDASFTCTSAINVMDCISQTQTSPLRPADPKSLIMGLNSQSFNLTGPVSLNVRYDDQLSWIIDGSYAEKFGNHFAVGLKGSYGPNEHRGNATLGFGITSNQQFKLTYEYLAQNLPFDFTSGTVNEWVNQNAFGGAYRYMFANNSFLKGIEVSGSYTKANSKELSVAKGYDDSGDVLERRIAGGQQQSGLASVIVTPFKYTLIKAGAGYSATSFDTKWDSNQSQSTIAYNVEASHLVTPKTLISTSVNNTATGRSHTVKVSRILPANLEGTVSGQYNFSHVDGIDNNGSVSVGLSYPAPKTYTNMFAGSLGDLKSWVQQPVIYNTRVLAVAEEKLHKAGIDAQPIPLQPIPVNTKINDIQIGNYFSFDKMVYDRIDYVISSITDLNGNPVNVDLKLSIQNEDSYTAKLYATDNMPAAAFTPGKYIVNLVAKGVQNNSTITQKANPFEVDVLKNGAIPAANWSKSNLPDAQVGLPYSTGPLSTYLKGIEGETFNFTIDDIKSAPWLKWSDDGQSLVSDGNVSAPPADNVPIVITATSIQSGVNANPVQQTLTLNIKSQNYKFPSWSNVKLPNAYTGLDYSSYNGNNNIPVALNPYDQGLSVYVVPTQDSNNKAIPDELTFTVGSSMDATGSNDPSDCSNWIAIGGPNPVILSGIAEAPPLATDKSSCKAYIKVYSKVFNETRYLKDASNNPYKIITFSLPGYDQPEWTNIGFPTANTGFKAYLNPNIDHGTAQLLTLTKNSQSKEPVTDPLSGFSVSTQTTCTSGVGINWLTIASDVPDANGNQDAYLTGTPPGNVSGTCNVYISYVSSLLGTKTTTTAKTLTFNSSAPQWIVNQAPYFNRDLDYTGNGAYTYNVSDNLQDHTIAATMNNIVFNNPILIKTQLPSGSGTILTGVNSTNDSPKKFNVTLVNPTIDDVVGRGSSYQKSTGQFTAVATAKDSNSDSVNGYFNVRIVADILNPQFNGTALPTFKIGQDYVDASGHKIDLNPYRSTPSPYMGKAKLKADGTTEVPNDPANLHFHINWGTPGMSDGTTCTGITISDDGIITWNPPAIQDSCKLVLNIKDDKNDSPNVDNSATISIQGYNQIPTWGNTTGSVQFDAIDVEDCVTNDAANLCLNLNRAINPEAVTLTPNFKFTFADNTTDYNYWHIEKGSNNNWYLLRRAVEGKINALDAGTVDTSFSIKAYNDLAMAGVASNNFSVMVTAEPKWDNIKPAWNFPNGSNVAEFTVTGTSSQIDLTSYVKTTITVKGTTYDIIDKWNATPLSTVMSLPQNSTATYLYNEADGTRNIDFTNKINPSNYGTYPNANAGYNTIKLLGFTAQSVKSTETTSFDISQYVKIYIKGSLTWNTSITPQPIPFYLTDIDTEKSKAIYLNNLMNIAGNTTLTGVKFEWADTQPDYWNLKFNGNDWYLVRATKNGALDAGDIAKSISISLKMSADGMDYSANSNIPVKVSADSSVVKLHSFIPVDGGQNIYDTMYITPRGGKGAYTNYNYMGASDSQVPTTDPSGKQVSYKKVWLISCFTKDRTQAGCSTPIVNDVFYHDETSTVGMPPNGGCTNSNMSGGNGGWSSHGFAYYKPLTNDSVSDGVSNTNGVWSVSFNEGDTDATQLNACMNNDQHPSNAATTILLGNNLHFYSRSQGKGAYNSVDNGIWITIKSCQDISKDQRQNYGCSLPLID